MGLAGPSFVLRFVVGPVDDHAVTSGRGNSSSLEDAWSLGLMGSTTVAGALVVVGVWLARKRDVVPSSFVSSTTRVLFGKNRWQLDDSVACLLD